MIKRMILKGGILVASAMIAQALLEKFERSSLKREVETDNEDSKKEVKITKEQLKEAFEQVHKLADEMEEAKS